MVKVNDRCRIVNDWLPAEAKKATVQVIGFQRNLERFAKVLWLGRNAREYQEKFGTLFPLQELRAI